MRIRNKKGDIEIHKLIGLIIAVIALILIITFIYLNWKPLKEALGKIGENVLGQTKDIMEIDKKQFLDQTITTQDEQLDKTIKDIDKLDCTTQPDAAVARWKQAVSLISNSKYKGKHKGEEPELQYKIINCYKQAENCEKVIEEFRNLRDKIQTKVAFDHTSKACADLFVFNCLSEEDKQKCQERVSTKGKVVEKEKIKEAEDRIKLEGLVGFNKKYKEAVENFNAKRYGKAKDLAQDLADAIYAVFPKFGESTTFCEELETRDNLPKGLCLQSDKFYMSSRYLQILSNYKGTNSCEQMESSFINDFAIDFTSLKDKSLALKDIRFIEGSNIGASDLTRKPIGSQVLYDLGKCFEEKNDKRFSKYYNDLLYNYPDESISNDLIRAHEFKCDSFDKVFGFNSEKCNGVNTWLSPNVGLAIKSKLRCWVDTKAALVKPLYSTCKSCNVIKTCEGYGISTLACTSDPCGFGNCEDQGNFFETKCVQKPK